MPTQPIIEMYAQIGSKVNRTNLESSEFDFVFILESVSWKVTAIYSLFFLLCLMLLIDSRSRFTQAFANLAFRLVGLMFMQDSMRVKLVRQKAIGPAASTGRSRLLSQYCR